MQGKRNANLQYLMQDADTSLLQVIDESVLAQLLAIGGDVSNYNTTTDSLEAISDVIESISEIEREHAIISNGVTYCVDAAQSDDTGDGLTPATAKKSIGAAITTAAAGDTILVKAGTYTENVVMSKDSMALICEPGVIIAGDSGTPLTVSGDYCIVRSQGGALRLNPISTGTGAVISGTWAYIRNCRVPCGHSANLGFDITGAGSVLIDCRSSDPLVAAFKIQADTVKLKKCCTGGTPADTSIGYWVTNNADKTRFRKCSSQGHASGGYVIDAGCTNGTAIDCVSGGGDGAKIDADDSFVWSNYTYDNIVYKDIEFTDNSTAFNLFKVTDIVKIDRIFGHVTEALNAELGNCKLEVVAGGNTTNLTTTVSLNSLPAGSFIGKVSDASDAMVARTSATPQVIENTSYKEPEVASIIVPEAGTDTYIRLLSDDSAGIKDGKIHWHCYWSPVGNSGFVQSA